MSRLALLHLALGFSVLVLASFMGIFNAYWLTEGYLHDSSLLGTWQATLLASSHGHLSLFAMIEILYALTLPYSRSSQKLQILQLCGFLAGLTAMGPLLSLRAVTGPAASTSLLGLVIGVLMSVYILGLLSHSYRLWFKWLRG